MKVRGTAAALGAVVLTTLLCVPAARAQSTVCFDQVQDRIAWDYRGSKQWSAANVQRLCAGAEDSVEPARCFQRVMHGGVDRGGGSLSSWREALALCAGTLDANASIQCFERRRDRLGRAQAIETCRWGSPAISEREQPTIIAPDRGVHHEIRFDLTPRASLRQRIEVVEHLCVHTPCELEGGWNKTAQQREYDGTETTSFEIDLPGRRLVRLCPVRGRWIDREFGGNGPAITASSKIEQQGNELVLTAFMQAEEVGGSSHAGNTWKGKIYSAPPGWAIADFAPRRSDTSYTDSNHEEDVPPVRTGTLVSEFRFKGDTGGDDIGNCTTDDTYMTLTYNPVTVTLRAEWTDLRPIRVPASSWTGEFERLLRNLRLRINNYDSSASQPERGVAENRYYIDRADASAWPRLSRDQVFAASYYMFRGARAGEEIIPPTPLPVPDIRRNTFTFLLNDIQLLPQRISVAPAGDHIRITFPFEDDGAEVVAACVDNVVCGTGAPHQAGKPLVQVDDLEVMAYFRPRVIPSGASRQVRAELTRLRMNADIARDGVCRDNAFAWACGAFAGDIEQIVHDQVLDQLNRYVARNERLTGLINEQVTGGVCALLALQGVRCDALENVVLDENGDLLLWVRG